MSFIKEMYSSVFSRLLTGFPCVLSCHSRVGGNLLNAFIVLFFLASCSDLGDRDNPLDPGASNYVTSKESDEDSSSSKTIQSSSSSKKTEVSSSSKDSKPVEVSSTSKKSESSSSVNQSSSEKSSESRSSSSSNKANSSSSVTQISSENTSSSSSKKIESSSSKTASSSSTNTLSSSSNKQESVLGYCSVAIADSVGLVGSTYYICKSGKWEEASVVEYDTYKWNAGKFDGEVRAGQVNKTIYYIYETGKKSWRNATTIEKDTYDYKNNKDWTAGADGQIQKGAVTDSIYVFDKTAWRVADEIERVLGGCVTAIADSVGKAGSIYYICRDNRWIEATEFEYDTYRFGIGEDGEIRKGNVTDSIYVYLKKWMLADSVERVLGGCVYGLDSIGKVGNTYYTCVDANKDCEYLMRYGYEFETGYETESISEKECGDDAWGITRWRHAVALQYDTHHLDCSEFGKIVHGKVNTNYEYVCLGKIYTPWIRYSRENDGVVIEEFEDKRDGKKYRAITYQAMNGMTAEKFNQTWMIDNLAYGDGIYTWTEAINAAYWDGLGKTCGNVKEKCNLPDKVQGVCPDGWHLPNHNECDQIINAYKRGEGSYLTATSMWWYENFGALWCTAEYDGEQVFTLWPADANVEMATSISYKSEKHGVRCIKDSDE